MSSPPPATTAPRSARPSGALRATAAFKTFASPVPFLGPAATQAEIDKALAETGDRIEVTRFASLEEACAEAARLIKDGRVLGWYRGRMEFGPRALGHRSILADPGHPEMRDRINAMVKMREAFRPFAPAVSPRAGAGLVRGAAGSELALYDHDRRCPPRISAPRSPRSLT